MSPNAEASSSKHKKRSKEERRSKKEHKTSVHKAKVEGPFEHRVQRMRLSVPPKYAADWLAGVNETLDGMLMR